MITSGDSSVWSKKGSAGAAASIKALKDRRWERVTLRCCHCGKMVSEFGHQKHERACQGMPAPAVKLAVGHKLCPCGRGRMIPRNVACCYLCEEREPRMFELDELAANHVRL